MDLFQQLEQIDHQLQKREEEKKQAKLFESSESTMGFMVDERVWQEIELERAREAESVKLRPLTAGIGPWSW